MSLIINRILKKKNISFNCQPLKKKKRNLMTAAAAIVLGGCSVSSQYEATTDRPMLFTTLHNAIESRNIGRQRRRHPFTLNLSPIPFSLSLSLLRISFFKGSGQQNTKSSQAGKIPAPKAWFSRLLLRHSRVFLLFVCVLFLSTHLSIFFIFYYSWYL